MSDKKFMITVRPADSVRDVYEVPSDTPALSVDSFAYLEGKQRKYDESRLSRPLYEFRAYAFVEVKTGFEENPEGTTVVYVDPKNQHLPTVNKN